ncbi:hypothetical protein ACFU8R_13960 [Pseudonocardia alni]|jgi:ABC-2 type transport system permease protein|uniref:hypothetical protein n=1 Tax=Pseudonocardia TaxID=1847 RepID=UPI00209699FD|nr:hypothetical protein [Pseudonocardia sp. McavD-2-B]MCO7193161.1 hypothetical protein [Pseudonocardia sp. McavD-2-B]
MTAAVTARREVGAGLGSMVRLVGRRDRIGIAAWIALAVSLPLASAAALPALVPTEGEQVAFATELARDPLTTALLGPVYGTSIEALIAMRSGMQSVFAVGIGSLVLVLRHTRAAEQDGHAELLDAAPVGRHVRLAAALLVTAVANLAIAALTVVTLVSLFGHPLAGSAVLALSAAGFGLVTAAVAAVAAQIAQTVTGARTIGFGLLAAAFAVRLVGDVAGVDALSWASPVGWVRLTRAFTGDQWWVLALFPAAAAALTVLAVRLAGGRDLGAGLLPARPGPAEGAPRLSTAVGLFVQLRLPGLIATTVAVGAACVGIGYASSTLDGLLDDSPMITSRLAPLAGSTLGEAFVAICLYLAGLGVACYVVATVLTLRRDETGRQAELLLATPTSRGSWIAGPLLIALIAPVVLLSVAGLAAAAGFTAGSARTDRFGAQMGAAMAQVPVNWIVAGGVVVLVGYLPRIAVAVAWGALAAAVIDLGLWELEVLPRPLYDPFSYTHPAVDYGPGTLVAMSLIGVGLIALGAHRVQRRDLG